MHYPIYQISTTPITEETYKSEFDYEDDEFVCGNTDYVEERKDREYDLQLLTNSLPKDCFILEGNVLTMVKKPTEFANAKIDNIKKLIDLLTIDKLSDPNDLTLFSLKRAIGGVNFFSPMIDFDDYFCTFEDWVLKTLQYDEGTKFYIGGIVGYHN